MHYRNADEILKAIKTHEGPTVVMNIFSGGKQKHVVYMKGQGS